MRKQKTAIETAIAKDTAALSILPAMDQDKMSLAPPFMTATYSERTPAVPETNADIDSIPFLYDDLTLSDNRIIYLRVEPRLSVQLYVLLKLDR